MKLIVISAVWCPSCLVMKKVLKELDDSVEIIKYDYDLDSDEIEKYNVGSNLPVFIFMDNDKEKSRIVGETTYEEILEHLNN